MKTEPAVRGPSRELERQIDDSIAARNKSNHGALQLDGDTSVSPSCQDNVNNNNTEGNERNHHVEAGIPPLGSQFEYLDHPADVILHSWGIDLSQALSNLALCMFGYMTALDSISINKTQSSEHGTDVTAQGHDMHSLLYSFLDEWLFNFHDSGFVPKEVKISECCREVWRIVSSGEGELLDIRRHPQGTEVKAITYSGMSVEEKEGRCDVYVVVDI